MRKVENKKAFAQKNDSKVELICHLKKKMLLGSWEHNSADGAKAE